MIIYFSKDEHLTIWRGSLDEITRCLNMKAATLGTVVYEEVTAAELAEDHGLAPEDGRTAFDRAGIEWVWRLGARYGWDTVLRRADYVWGIHEYRPIPVERADAIRAFLRSEYTYAGVIADEEPEETGDPEVGIIFDAFC